MTGVQTRYWAAESQTSGDLCLAAARHLLARLEWPADSVDALLFVTQAPDQRLPATACGLHGQLGFRAGRLSFDINLGCSGYVYGLWLASAMLAAGCRRILVLAGDTSSRLLDPADRSTVLLFGDAGSACALEYPGRCAPNRRVFAEDHAICRRVDPDFPLDGPGRILSATEEKVRHFRSSVAIERHSLGA